MNPEAFFKTKQSTNSLNVQDFLDGLRNIVNSPMNYEWNHIANKKNPSNVLAPIKHCRAKTLWNKRIRIVKTLLLSLSCRITHPHFFFYSASNMHKTILAPHNKYRRTYTRTPHSLSDSCVSTLHCAAQLSVCVCVSVRVLYKVKNSLFLALSSRCQCNNVGISFRLFSDSRMPQYHRISTYDIVCAYLCEPHHATHKVKAATRQRPVRERKKFIKLVSCYAVLARFSIQVERNKRNGVFWERWTFLHRFPTIKKNNLPHQNK